MLWRVVNDCPWALLQSIRQKGMVGIFFIVFVIFIDSSLSASNDLSILSPTDLKKLSIEELMNIEVISPGRKPQDFSRTAAAIDVITSEDIHRSGARTIVDALRLVTGLHIAESNHHQWVASARGFNLSASNKMQVLLDGRNLYTPLFTGVFWDVQQYPLEDVDRIEIIRGPGATLWGGNSVNGVINIITKSAKDTQGGYVNTLIGKEERGMSTIRYGGKVGDNTFYRVYGRGFNFDDMEQQNGLDAEDDWYLGQSGFRVDSNLDEDDLLTVQGDIYYGEKGIPARDDTGLFGANFLGRWTHTYSEESDLMLQLYYDRTSRTVSYSYEEDRDAFDFELQHRFPIGDRHDIVWGLNYHLSSDNIQGSTALTFIPSGKNLQLFSGFLQDEITLLEDELYLTFGTKLEHNDYSGFEVQPSARIAWLPTKRQTVWAAVSRSVRTPSRLDAEVVSYLPNGSLNLIGDPNFKAETLLAYELGYRIQPLDTLSFDFAAFYNQYDRLRSQEQILPPAPRPILLGNKVEATTYGFELETNYDLTHWWRLSAGYTFFIKDLDVQPDSTDSTRGISEGNDPENLFTFRSAMDVTRDIDFDVIFRYVDELPNPFVPHYLVMDVRLGWTPTENLELAIVGRNLLDDSHPEFGSQASPLAQEVESSVYASLTLRF